MRDKDRTSGTATKHIVAIARATEDRNLCLQMFVVALLCRESGACAQVRRVLWLPIRICCSLLLLFRLAGSSSPQMKQRFIYDVRRLIKQWSHELCLIQ
jgi:hypothetical protein